MALLQCGLAIMAAVNVAVPSHPVGNAPARRLQSVQPPHVYAVSEAEHYLTAEQIGYIRPGFKIKNFTLSNVGAGKKPLVEIWYVDDMDQPLDYLGKATPGPLSISFILAWYNGPARQYTTYTTRVTGGITIPSSDQGGTWNHIELGHSKYTFGTTLPAGLDVTKTHTLGIYGRRDVRQWLGKYYYLDNTNYDFRPDGAPVTETWAAMDVDKTCNNCHDPLALHGGTRRTTKNCVLCHTPQIPIIEGENFDFKVFIHKLHKDTTYPQDLRNCTTCHQTSAAEGYIWYSRPSRKACGSCHDNIDWVTGENHVAGPQADDSACASCHIPQGESEFDASIKGAHTIPTKSAQLAGLKMQILSVTNTSPGSKPTVTFKVTNGDGSNVTPSSLNRLRFRLGGPTTDYTTALQEDGVKATASGDAWVYTFTSAAIPADATGSWVMAADCYRNVTIDNHTETGLSVREAAQNPIYYFAVTDSQAVARRTSVDVAKCNKCHDVLALHGGQRFKIEECVICHNPGATTESVEGEPDENINLNRMVHRIHTGEELTHDYSIGGTSFNEVLYPGDRRNCVACHVTGKYTVPLPDGVLPTVAPRDYYTPMQPTAAACLGCHDSKPAAIHAYTMTTALGESCEVCHSNNAEFSVDQVHAR